jgi:hypothetical protein
MSDIYEKQEDGTLKPIEQPSWVIKRLIIYNYLRRQELGLDEIRFLLLEFPPLG